MENQKYQELEDEILYKSIRDTFIEMYTKAEELNRQYPTVSIQIGIYYNMDIEAKRIYNWLAVCKPFELYVCSSNYGYSLESRNHDISIRIIKAIESSRGQRNNVVMYSNKIKQEMVDNIIRPSICNFGIMEKSIEDLEDLDPTWKFEYTY